MILVHTDQIQEGMILADNIRLEGCLLLSRGTVLNEKRLEQLKKHYKSPFLWVDNSEELQNTIRIEAPELPATMEKKIFLPGQYVCVQGEKADCLYILAAGELDVIYTDNSLLTEQKDIMEKLSLVRKYGKKVNSIKGRMSNFGEIGVILGENRGATLCACKNSLLAIIPTDTAGFCKTLLNTPVLGLNIAITTAKRLKETYSRISEYKKLIDTANIRFQKCSDIYTRLAKNIYKKAEKGKNYTLCCIHDQIKLSMLYSLTRKVKDSTMEETCISRKSTINTDEKIFFYGEIVKKKIGEYIFSSGETGNCMYILIYGSIGVFRDNKLIATYKNKGDLIGTVTALLNHASGQKKSEPRKNEVKALSYSRLLCIKPDDFSTLVKNNPDLVLHITRTLAENLKEALYEYSEIQKSTEKIVQQFCLCRNSCAIEVQNIFSMFLKKTELAQECCSELKILSHLPELVDDSYQELSTKIDILNTEISQKGNCAVCL